MRLSPATRLDGKPVFAWEHTGLDNQQWIIRKSGDDWWKYAASHLFEEHTS